MSADRIFFSHLLFLLLCMAQVEAMLAYCRENPQYQRYGMLYLLAYVFLLRLPSEALPAVVGASDTQSSIILKDDILTVVLQRRCE